MKKQLTGLKESEKPYDRFLYAGASSLSDAELLAIILRTGRKGADATIVAKEILGQCGAFGLSGLYHLSLDDLEKIPGIGQIKAIKLKCIAELSERIARTKRKQAVCFKTPKDFADYYMETLRHFEDENSVCVFLNGSMHLVKDVILSIGKVNASIISAREIFMEALSAKAVYIVLLHNHPSGSSNPSKSDIDVTNHLKQASIIMDIPLLDHIIIGDNDYYSFKEHDLI